MKRVINNLAEMQKFAEEFAQGLMSQKAKPFATLIGLKGNLGSGKTTFTQFFAKTFGIEETITSPTFVIQKRYEIKNNENFDNLIHIDAYRLKDGNELSALNFEETLSNTKNIILLEWPELVEEALPEDIQTIEFNFIDNNTREIEIL